jgi:hypothetical protein
LVCTKHPTKSSGLAICPLAMGGGGAGPIPASRPRSRPGNGSGRVRAHLWEGRRSWLGRRSCRRGVRRRPAASATAARGSGEEKRTDDNVRHGKVLRVLGVRVRSERCSKFTGDGNNGGWRLGRRAEGENGGV